jgi:predicted amidohydrolase
MPTSAPAAPLRVALAQMKAVPGDVAANVALTVELIGRARAEGAALIVFPELSLTGYELDYLAGDPAGWFTTDDPRLDPIRAACAAGITAVVSAAVRDGGGEPRLAGLVIAPDGSVALTSKQYMHGIEATLFHPGAPAAPFTVQGWRVAIGICFDAADPRHAEAAATAGADLYVVPAVYAVGEERRVDLHFGARAMDNRIFTALANHAGITGRYASIGGSGVWGPTGAVVHRLGDALPALATVELDPEQLRAFRGPA